MWSSILKWKNKKKDKIAAIPSEKGKHQISNIHPEWKPNFGIFVNNPFKGQ